MATIFFYIFFTLILLSEGLGILNGRGASFCLILLMPLFLFLLDYCQNRKIIIPKTPTILFSLFILFSFFSFIFSIDKQESFPKLLLYISTYLMFIFAYNHKQKLEKQLFTFLLIISSIFCIYTIFLRSFLPNNLFFFMPTTGYQFVFSKFGIHNHLGDFLLLPLIGLLYLLLEERKKKSLLLLVIFLLFFIFSYSRSAYLAFMAVVIFMIYSFRDKLKLINSKVWIVCSLIILTAAFLLMASIGLKNNLALNRANTLFYNSCVIQSNQKSVFGSRPYFFAQSGSFFLKKPFFGVGPNNYRKVTRYSFSSHNLFLDLLVENGLFAFVVFLAFLFVILKKSSKNLYYFLFLAMIINFMVDYTFMIYGFYLLFFVISGLIYTPKANH